MQSFHVIAQHLYLYSLYNLLYTYNNTVYIVHDMLAYLYVQLDGVYCITMLCILLFRINGALKRFVLYFLVVVVVFFSFLNLIVLTWLVKKVKKTTATTTTPSKMQM